MADQNLNVELTADAEPMLDALATVDEHLVNITAQAKNASQSLGNIEAAGELVAESAERVASGVETANGKLDVLNTTASEASAKLEDIKCSTDKAADGVKELGDKASVANNKLEDIKASSRRAADGIGEVKDTSKKAADGVKELGDKADATNGKLDDIKVSSQKAAGGIEVIGHSSAKTATNVSKAGEIITEALEKINETLKPKKKSLFTFLGETSIKFNAIAHAAKKLAVPLQKAIGQLQEIGEKAKSLGTSAEYFQKLEKASEKFEDVQAVFTRINETAKKALSGNADAAKKLADIGIAVDDLRGKSPDQIFEHVAGALAAAGDEAINSEAALAVCGDRLAEIGDNLGDLANTSVKIADSDIIPDEAVQASLELKENFSKLGQELLVLIAQSGFLDWLADAARIVGRIKDSIKEIKAARDLVEKGEVRDLGAEHNKKLDDSVFGTAKTAINIATLGLGYIPKLWGGRSLGAVAMGYRKEGVDIVTEAVSPEKVAQAKEDRKRQREEDARKGARTREAIAAAKSPDAQMPKGQETGREAERARREAERQELQRRREEARAAMQRQRELERLRREEERARQRDIQTAERPARKRKRKSREVGESAQLSTAGSISDPKAARAQRRHELRLAREAAKQKITVKVRPVKGAVIRNAVSTAVGGSLKQLAAAVERLSRQTYIVK